MTTMMVMILTMKEEDNHHDDDYRYDASFTATMMTLIMVMIML